MRSERTSDGPEPPPEKRRLHLASWKDRFYAWLIDFLLVGVLLSGLGEVGGVSLSSTDGLTLTAPFVGLNIGLWAYWTVLEGYHGQSAGKMYMDIAVTDERGDAIGYLPAAIESFGKAFLLPLDVLIGWIAAEEEYTRLFNKLSSTIVIEVPEADTRPADVEYIPPER